MLLHSCQGTLVKGLDQAIQINRRETATNALPSLVCSVICSHPYHHLKRFSDDGQGKDGNPI